MLDAEAHFKRKILKVLPLFYYKYVQKIIRKILSDDFVNFTKCLQCVLLVGLTLLVSKRRLNWPTELMDHRTDLTFSLILPKKGFGTEGTVVSAVLLISSLIFLTARISPKANGNSKSSKYRQQFSTSCLTLCLEQHKWLSGKENQAMPKQSGRRSLKPSRSS